jgi:hypothetical protein
MHGMPYAQKIALGPSSARASASRTGVWNFSIYLFTYLCKQLRVFSGLVGFMMMREDREIKNEMEAIVHQNSSGQIRAGGESRKMKSLVAAAVLICGLSVSGFAQQQTTFYKGKKSSTAKPSKSAPLAPPMKATTQNSSAKDLQLVERQSAKSAGPTHQPKQKALVVKPIKDKPTPPMVFNGSGGSKATGGLNQSANPYRGRLKQKNSGNVH